MARPVSLSGGLAGGETGRARVARGKPVVASRSARAEPVPESPSATAEPVPASSSARAGPVPESRSARSAARRSGQDLARALLERCEFPPGPAPAGTTGSAVLAVSGGADSLALLVLAARAGLDVLAVHVDHGLRSGSDREAGVVAAAAAAYGAAFETRSVTVPPGPDLEARARQARYRVLPAGVLTGHTMDDQAETVLLAILRGAGLDGLAGMRGADRPATGRLGDRADRRESPGAPLRPLLGLRRWETAALCAAEGLIPVDDPTNRDLRFRRNRVRHQVLPMLCEVAGRDLVPVLARQAGLLRDDAGLLEGLAVGIDATDARQLTAAPRPLARRAVRRWLRSDAAFPDAELHPPTAGEVARVLAVASGAARACELTGGRRVERHGGRLRVVGR